MNSKEEKYLPRSCGVCKYNKNYECTYDDENIPLMDGRFKEKYELQKINLFRLNSCPLDWR